MTAKYWTKDGEVMCRLSVRTVFEFKNLDTDEVLTLDNMHDVIDAGFLPVTMPKVKKAKKQTKANKETTAKTSKRVKTSKYKGVSFEKKTGKWKASYWDGNKPVYLGTFDYELLAAAAYQEKIGDPKEAKRLWNEHEEGYPARRPMDE
jgi:hypothetical protein